MQYLIIHNYPAENQDDEADSNPSFHRVIFCKRRLELNGESRPFVTIRKAMTVDDYINRQTSEHARILRRLRQLILNADPAVRETIRWSVPSYTYHKKHVRYLSVHPGRAIGC